MEINYEKGIGLAVLKTKNKNFTKLRSLNENKKLAFTF